MRQNRKYTLLVAMVLMFTMLMPAGVWADSYPSQAYVKEGEFTIRFPNEAWIITQESQRTDEYFQTFGEDSYEDTIAYMKETDTCLQAIDKLFGWEAWLDIAADDMFDFRGIDQTMAEEYANLHLEVIENSGMQVEKSCVVMHPYTPMMMFAGQSDGYNYVLCMTYLGEKSIMINVSEVIPGFANLDELMKTAESIVNGLIFDAQKLDDKDAFRAKDKAVAKVKDTSAVTQTEYPEGKIQKVEVEETGVILSLPEGMKWATRTGGDIDYMAEVYHQSFDRWPSYMESVISYLEAADPHSSLRISFLMMEAKADESNYNCRTDEELLSVFAQTEKSGTLSLMTLCDQWVWRNNKETYLCTLYHFIDDYCINAQTGVDGTFYAVNLRDTDEGKLRSLVDTILGNTYIPRQEGGEVLSLKTGDREVALPHRWVVYNQDIQKNTDGSEMEVVTLDAYKEDGTRGIVSLALTDMYAAYYPFGEDRQRSSFDQAFGSLLLDEMLKAWGVQGSSRVSYGGCEVRLFRPGGEDNCAAITGIANGYAFRLEWMLLAGNAMNDELRPIVQSFVGDLIKALKK